MGRAPERQGRTVRLMSLEYVRPDVKAQKNDYRDAKGIPEVATRPTMRFVELKTEEHIGAVHHVFEHVAEYACHDVTPIDFAQGSLAPLYLLARVVSARLTASVVFTDWLSMPPAVGAGVRPSDTRTHAISPR